MKALATDQEKTINNLATKFGKYRKAHSGDRLRYPQWLKNLAVLALKEKIPLGRVAQASGVSPISLRSWSNQLPAPVELQVVPDAVAVKASFSNPNPTARIKTRNGFEIEFPLSALTRSLIENLCGGAL
jgi:hypothetical protein